MLNFTYYRDSNLFDNGNNVSRFWPFFFLLNFTLLVWTYDFESRERDCRLISGDRNVSFEEDEENHHPVVIETNELKKIVSL